ncbi:MAG: diadenylate cyclase CdaA [Bacteroidales bacterium]|nr:diadenylate cyclase CdaA [Bacteroidales bacterium]MBR1785534.1 diadenylate cyclase CdaA [Bacteroidales bacterium]
MPLLALAALPSLRVIDIFDIVIVAALVYYIYRMARGTNVMLIFWALIILLLAWRLADLLQMRLLGALLSAVWGVGLIALVVIFQPEIRKFLLFLGTKTQLDESLWHRLQFWRSQRGRQLSVSYEAYVVACMHMSQTKTGALMVFKRHNSVEELVGTGERLDAEASNALIETLFFKNSPLHDGAVIAHNNRLLAARCILPVTSRLDIDPNLGLRHRSAIGVTEQLDVLAVIVSEETGAISYAVGGVIHHDVSPVELRQALERYEC